MPPKRRKKYNARFPPARIKKIMQKDEEVGKVAATVPVVISRALELFIESLVLKAAETTKAKSAKTLTSSHLKHAIMSEKNFDFLKELVADVADTQPGEAEASWASTPHEPQVSPVVVQSSEPQPSTSKARKIQKVPGRGRGRPRKNVGPAMTVSVAPLNEENSDEEEKHSFVENSSGLKDDLSAASLPESAVSLSSSPPLTQLTQETDDAQMEQETADAQMEQETVYTQIKQEMGDAQMKQETADAQIEQETADAQIEQETADAQMKPETADTQIKQETADAQMKQETVDTQIEQEMVDTQMKQETANAQIEQETADAQQAQETADTQLKHEPPDMRLTQATTDTQMKQTPDMQMKPETADLQMKHGTVHRDVEENLAPLDMSVKLKENYSDTESHVKPAVEQATNTCSSAPPAKPDQYQTQVQLPRRAHSGNGIAPRWGSLGTKSPSRVPPPAHMGSFPAGLPTTFPAGLPTSYPAGLPTTTFPASLPTSFPAGLPTTTFPANLSTSFPAGLPTTTFPAGLPTSYPAGLPTTTFPAGLPTSFPAGLPTMSFPAGLPTTSLPAGLPTTTFPGGSLTVPSFPASSLPTVVFDANSNASVPPSFVPALMNTLPYPGFAYAPTIFPPGLVPSPAAMPAGLNPMMPPLGSMQQLASFPGLLPPAMPMAPVLPMGVFLPPGNTQTSAQGPLNNTVIIPSSTSQQL